MSEQSGRCAEDGGPYAGCHWTCQGTCTPAAPDRPGDRDQQPMRAEDMDDQSHEFVPENAGQWHCVWCVCGRKREAAIHLTAPDPQSASDVMRAAVEANEAAGIPDPLPMNRTSDGTDESEEYGW